MTTDDSRRVPDGFAGDRRIRPAQFFQLDVGLPGRNFIHIWLPEGVSCEHGSLYFVPGGESSGTWETDADGSVTCRRELPHELHMESSVHEVDYGVPHIGNLLGGLSNRCCRHVDADDHGVPGTSDPLQNQCGDGATAAGYVYDRHALFQVGTIHQNLIHPFVEGVLAERLERELVAHLRLLRAESFTLHSRTAIYSGPEYIASACVRRSAAVLCTYLQPVSP